MPEDEKRFWRLFLENEWKRGEMRKTDVYKAMHQDGAPAVRLEPAVDAPTVPDRDG